MVMFAPLYVWKYCVTLGLSFNFLCVRTSCDITQKSNTAFFFFAFLIITSSLSGHSVLQLGLKETRYDPEKNTLNIL